MGKRTARDGARRVVIEALGRRKAVGLDLSPSGVRLDHKLSAAIAREFGSYRAALEAAGIDYASVRRTTEWTAELVLAKLRERQAEGGRLRAGDVFRDDQHLYDAAFRYFGSYRNALEAIGVAYPDDGHDRWTPNKIVETLRGLRSAGQDMRWTPVHARWPRLCTAALLYFGSYRAAMDAAGLDYVGRRGLDTWTAELVLEGIRRVRADGGDLTSSRMKAQRAPLFNAARHFFGSYRQALCALGIDYERDVRPRQPKWTPERILQALRDYHANGNNPPRVSVSKGNASLAFAAKRQFGSLPAAVEAAGLTYLGRAAHGKGLAHWTEALVLAEIRELHGEGADLRYTVVKQHRQPLFWAAKHFFGSYVNAVREAGVDYWEMSQLHLARAREAKARSAREVGESARK